MPINRLIIFLILSAFSCVFLHGQTGFSDSFLDSNFIDRPIWEGQISKFVVNASKQLQLNDTSNSSPAYLSTRSKVINNAIWEFFIRLDFSPSGSNFARVYLVSDQEDLAGSLNGYFVQIGGQSGAVDEVSFYKQEGNTETLLIDGADGTVADDPSLKVRVIKDSLANWELLIDTSTSFNGFVSQGKINDNAINSSTYFGVFCRYTSTRSDRFFFDDFNVIGEAFKDTVIPQLLNVQVLTSSSLKLIFSENLDEVSALDSNNYIVNKGIGKPDSLEFLNNDSSVIRLAFDIPFSNGEELEIQVRNIRDKSGNTIQPDTLGFNYFKPDTADYKDVVINEFYPDFNPSNGLPDGEFIELFNRSDKIVDLNNWSLGDLSSTAQLNGAILRPGEYLIICPVNQELEYSALGRTMGIKGFPALNNNGDLIELRDQNDHRIDRLTYSLSWYRNTDKDDGGWTIEQVNPFTDCHGIANFRASTAINGGTPGQQNSVYDTLPDTIAPVLINATVLAEDSILLSFDEAIDSTSFSSALFNFSDSTVVHEVQFYNSEELILLLLSGPLDSGKVIRLEISGFFDCAMNGIALTGIDLLVPGIPQFRDVVINEIFADFSPSQGLPEAEFVELYNASDKLLDLKDWSLSDPTTKTNLGAFLFKPGDYIIICAQSNTSAFEKFGQIQGQLSMPSLNNSGDRLTLRDARGNLIDIVTYSDEWYGDAIKKGGGYSLEQINPQTPCTGRSNFIASRADQGGTPGQVNSVFDSSPDTKSPAILDLLILGEDSLEILLDESIDTNNLSDFDYSFSTSLNEVDTVINIAASGDRILLILKHPLDSGKSIAISISGLFDCSGNEIEENVLSILLPEKARPLDLVINEILFNPRTGGEDFIELFNRSERIISLENWELANIEDGIISNHKLIIEKPFLIFPGEYIGLTADIQNIAFEYPFTRTERFIELSQLPSFNNDEGSAFVLNGERLIIDQITYNEGMHFELLDTKDGVSLERLDPDRASDDPGNFHSAAENQNFATPGYKNSQLFKSIRFKGEITIEPEVFSPDNDGHQDLLNINYRFESPGFVANVSIYDRNGRLIRRLISNELLGQQGNFTWDGITDDNEKARLGIYVILVETFHPNGEKETFKETTVLGGFLD